MLNPIVRTDSHVVIIEMSETLPPFIAVLESCVSFLESVTLEEDDPIVENTFRCVFLYLLILIQMETVIKITVI